MQRASRLKRELALLSTEPPPGITCWQNQNQLDDLRARTSFSGGFDERGLQCSVLLGLGSLGAVYFISCMEVGKFRKMRVFFLVFL